MSGSCSPGDGRQNCSDSNDAGPRLSAPSGTKKRKRGRQPGWSCSACTLLNSNRRRKCEACQNQRDSNDDQQQLVTDKAALNAVANANDTNLSLPPPRSQSRSRRSSSSSGGSVTDWLRRRKIKSRKESRSFSGCQSSVQTATSIVADFSNNRHFTPKQSVKVRVCYGNHLLSSDSGPLIADIPCMVWARVSTGFVKSTVEDEAKQKREKENAFEMLVGPTELKAALQLSGQVCDTNEEDPASDDNIFRAQTLSDSLSPDGAQDQNQEHNPPVKIGEGVESITRCGRTDFARTPLNNILVEEDDKNLMESETAASSLPIYSFVQNTDNNLGRCNREKGSEAAIDDVSFDGKTAIHLNHKQHTREAISIACKPLIDLTSSSPVLFSQQFTASVSQNCQTLTPGVESFEYSLTQQNFDYRDTSEQQLQNQENMVLPDPIFVHGDAHNPSTHSSPPLSSSVAMTKPPPSLSLASGQGGFRSTFATAGKGAAISVSEEAMDKARKLLGDQSGARSAPPSSAPPPPSLSLASGQGGFRSTFATAGKGAAISVSEEAMDKARKLLGDQSGARSAPPSSAPPPPSLSLASGQGGFRSTFATAGKGAAISVSEEAMDKARKLLGDQSGARSAPPSSAPPPPSLSLASGQGGFRSTFATAGKGAAISVSEEAMDKARKLLGDQSGARSAPPSSAPPPPSLSLASGQGGFRSTFATAGKGAAISVSEEAMDKARKLLGDQSGARSAPPSSAPPPPSLSLASGQGGFRSTFATAGKGAAISVSEEAMDKARKLLGDQSGARSAPPSSAPPPPSLSLASGQGGFRSTFATAGKGAAISVSEEAMDKARKLLGDQSGARSAPPSSAPPPPSLSLASGQGGFRSTFATAGKGAAISVSEEAMDKARKLLGDQSGARSAPPSSAPPPPSLSLASGQGGFRSTFATAGKGTAISVSEEAMDKAQKIFGQQSSSALLSQKALSIDKDVIEYMDERSGVSTIPLMRKKALVFDDTCTPFIRRRSMGRVSFGEATNGMLAEHLHPTETPLPGKSKRPRHFSTNKVLFGKDPFELSESSISAYSGVSNTSVRSKVMSTFTPKNSSRVVKGTALVTRSTTIKNPYARKQLDVSSHGAVTPVPFNVIGGTFAVRKFSPRSLANRNSHPEPGRSATVPPHSIPYAQQSLWSDKKEIAHFQFSPSSDERISLRELDTRIGPMVRSASECVELGLSADLLEVNSTNAAKIRFYEGSGLPCNVLGDASYGVSKLVGSVKDVRQKLVNLGCNDSLLTDRWILNHLGWINWKLASTERRFPGVLGGKYLNYEHVIGQLQRRFKKEIRDTKRPAVRLVLNRDVPSSRLMILCVSQIKKRRVPRAGIELAVGAEGDRAASSHEKEFCLELTDGWYPIPAVMDEHLQTFVKEDKIKVGSKLLISSAELVGAEDGIDPLDDSYYTSRPNCSVALKLVANATRLAKWDAKLGFVRPTPTVQSRDGLLLVRSLAGVIPGGGNIPLIDFVISRRFPVMYLEKRNGTASVILTKAQEERHQREFDEKRDREVEKIADGVEKECTKLVDEHAPEKWKEMISSTSMCDYYEGLSAQDRASVDAWKDKRSSMIRDKTNQAVDSRIQSNESMNRKSIPFCRFSVLSFVKQRLPVDTESDDDEGVVLVCKQAIATLTVWRMSEDQCNLLKEGSVVRMKHLSVLDGFRNGQLQLSANDKTKMQSCPTQTSSSQIKLSGYTKRFYTSIVRIHALSRKAATSRNRTGVDFVGCLVRLNIDEKGIAPLVSAYFTDESGLLLRLQRQGEGIGDSNILAWGKKLVEGKALSFRDVDILPYDFSANCAVAAWSLVTVEEKVAKTTCRKRAVQKGENSIHTSSMASFDAMLPLHSRLSGNAEIAVGYILSLRIDCDARGARGKETGSKCHLIDIDCSGAAGVITATCPQSVLFQTLQLHLADCSRHGEAMANTQNYLQGKINHGANHDETASLETLLVESGILFQVTLRRESCHAIGECELRVVQMAPANTDALASLYWESLTAHNM